MGIRYLWDTNTVIYYLQQQFPAAGTRFVDSTWADSQPAISAITEIELLCWKTTIEKDQEVLHNFIADAWVFELEKDSKLKTAELRRAHKDPCSLNPAPCLRKQVYRGLRLQS